jgi:hypothetical protein
MNHIETIKQTALKIPAEVWCRTCGYFRPVDNQNSAKRAEFEDRKYYSITKASERNFNTRGGSMKLSRNEIIVFFICMAVAICALICCNTFTPVKPQLLAEYPECIVFLNSGEVYRKGEDKSGTVLPVDACLNAIKRQRCAKEVFGESGVIWSDKDKMYLFNDCLTKK